MFSLQTFLDAFVPLAWAARYTLLVSCLGIALGLVIGVVVCAMRLSGSRLARGIGALWVSFLRGVPLLVQLLLMFYLLPVIGIDNFPDSVPLETFDLPRECVLPFGQEGPGLTPEVVARCEAVLHIEQFGSTRSINAGQPRRWRCTPGCASTSTACRPDGGQVPLPHRL